VNLAASGKNPTQTLIASFLVLIVSGAGLLMLPTASAENKESLGLVDALFTATSATCVTGLIVKDTGEHFSIIGQVVILTLIQLGGLGIVVFGAVFALLLGQTLSLRESVAMQDLLSARTLGRIRNMIGFIFVGTIFIELAGVLCLHGMWGQEVERTWYYSIFHSISAFCNAGFGLFNDSLEQHSGSWHVYAQSKTLFQEVDQQAVQVLDGSAEKDAASNQDRSQHQCLAYNPGDIGDSRVRALCESERFYHKHRRAGRSVPVGYSPHGWF
jgi:trk system potassium uptake protein TrkH